MSKQPYNKVTVFLYPLLNIPLHVFKMTSGKSRFVNAYLFDENLKNYRSNHIFILVDNYQDTSFKNFETKITSLNHFVTDYDILDGRYSVKVFKIQDEHIRDYESFLQGKYSKFSTSAKDKVFIYELKDQNSLKHTFDKSEYGRKKLEERLGTKLEPGAEVQGIYSHKKDILNIDIKTKSI